MLASCTVLSHVGQCRRPLRDGEREDRPHQPRGGGGAGLQGDRGALTLPHLVQGQQRHRPADGQRAAQPAGGETQSDPAQH